MPLGVLASPQAPATQVRVWHSVSWPAQVAAVRHCTQAPALLHTVPPFWLQTAPWFLFGCPGAPAVQVSSVHWLPSSAGRSVSSTESVMPPMPSQTFL